MNVRNWIYTLLSRKFWVGIGIGFFLASFLVFANSAHAADIPSTGLVKLYGSYAINSDPTGSSMVASSNVYSYATYFEIKTICTAGTCTNHRIATRLYPASLDISVTTLNVTYVKTGSCTTAVAKAGTMSSDFDYGSNLFDTASSSGYKSFTVTSSDRSTSAGIAFRMSTQATCSLQIHSVTDNLGNEYVVADSGGGGGSASGDITFNPIKNDGIVTNVNCLSSATGSDCILQYASSTVAVSPENILIFEVLFLIAFAMGYWVVRKLT